MNREENEQDDKFDRSVSKTRFEGLFTPVGRDAQ